MESSMNGAMQEALIHLRRVLDGLEAGVVWRPVLAPPWAGGGILHEGLGGVHSADAGLLDLVDVAGKRVVDLGCNVGFYSLAACARGAAAVTGYDVDERALAVARLAAQAHGYAQASFERSDFIKEPPDYLADVVLLVDFIGRAVVRRGKLARLAQSVAGMCAPCGRVFATVRPAYALAELEMSAQDVVDVYGEAGRAALDATGQTVQMGPLVQGLLAAEGASEGGQWQVARVGDAYAAVGAKVPWLWCRG